MFDVGFWEILLILVLALVVIGPERLPGAARKAGFFVGKARRYIEGVRSEVESELDVGEFKRMLHNQEIQINELQQQLQSGVDDVKSDLSADLAIDSNQIGDSSTHSFHEESINEMTSQDSSSSDDSSDEVETQDDSSAINKDQV